MNRKTAAIIVAISASLGIGGVAIGADLAGTGEFEEAEAPATTAKDPAETVPAALAAHLRVFRDKEAASASLPTAVDAIVESDLAGRYGANSRLAVEARTPAGPVYLVAGDNAVCQIGHAGAACGPVEELGGDPRAYTLFGYSAGVNPPGTVTVSGIATDNVARIQAWTADGKTIDVPIRDNAYSSYVPRTTARVVYQLDSGQEFARSLPEEFANTYR